MKKIKGLATLTCCALAFTMSASADVVKETVDGVTGKKCIASTWEDFKTANADAECRVISVAPDSTIDVVENITVDNKIIYLDDNAKMNVDGNVDLIVTNFVPDKVGDKKLTGAIVDTTQFLFDDKASLNITNGGEVFARNMKGIVFQVAQNNISVSINIDGYIDEENVSGLYIADSANGIAGFDQVNVSNGGVLGFVDNSGYGSNSATIVLHDGTLVAKGNLIGVTSKLVTTGNSIVGIEDNKIIGLNLKEGTNIGGATVALIQNNNTNNDTERGGDLTIFATETDPVVISDEAVVMAGTTRSYYDKFAPEGSKDTKGALTINGDSAIFIYEENQKNTDGTENITLENGALGNATTGVTLLAGTPNLDLPMEKGETLIIKNGTDLTNVTISAEEGTIIKNETDEEVTVKIGEETVTIVAGEEKEFTAPTTTTPEPTPGTGNEVKNPETGDINVIAVLSVALVSLVGCRIVARKKKLAHNR